VITPTHHDLDLADGGLVLSVAAVSDRGRVRVVNEDSYLAHPPVFLVADGMGGHRFGDRASSATARSFARLIAADRPTTVRAVIAAMEESHRQVVQLAGDEQAGTTLSGIAIVQEPGDPHSRWMAFNIGDSRVYGFSAESGLRQISVDHSAVQELVDNGEISRQEAETHPERNVITRALGTGPLPDPDVWLFPIEGEQSFLICSDGLTKELGDTQIAAVVAESGEPADIARELVGAALQAGASDNVTVVIVSARRVDAPSTVIDHVPAHLETTLPREDRR